MQIVKDTRPVNLNLFKMKFPVTAIVSILHRLTGVLLFFLIPILLWVFDLSLRSSASYLMLQKTFLMWPIKLLAWLALSAFIYHLIAGLRHLIMDMGFGEGLISSKIFSWATFAISGLLIITLGVTLWGL
jgi:succinate dehydrogenase / fumarate reductase cytochrome b subunit